jgi:hypothetical protein
MVAILMVAIEMVAMVAMVVTSDIVHREIQDINVDPGVDREFTTVILMCGTQQNSTLWEQINTGSALPAATSLTTP